MTKFILSGLLLLTEKRQTEKLAGVTAQPINAEGIKLLKEKGGINDTDNKKSTQSR